MELSQNLNDQFSGIQLLGQKHTGVLTELLKKSAPIFKLEELVKQNFEDQAANLLNDNRNVVFGLFSGSSLVASLSAFRWKGLPYFTLGSFKADLSFRGFGFYKYVTQNLIIEVIKQMENEGRYTFYALTRCRGRALRHFKRENEFWGYKKPFEDYIINVEALLPPHTVPEYDIYWEIMHKKTYPIFLWIRRGMLNEKKLIEKLANRIVE